MTRLAKNALFCLVTGSSTILVPGFSDDAGFFPAYSAVCATKLTRMRSTNEDKVNTEIITSGSNPYRASTSTTKPADWYMQMCGGAKTPEKKVEMRSCPDNAEDEDAKSEEETTGPSINTMMGWNLTGFAALAALYGSYYHYFNLFDVCKYFWTKNEKHHSLFCFWFKKFLAKKKEELHFVHLKKFKL